MFSVFLNYNNNEEIILIRFLDEKNSLNQFKYNEQTNPAPAD